jgi:hypothetical protein
MIGALTGKSADFASLAMNSATADTEASRTCLVETAFFVRPHKALE